jgi:serralysin
MNALATPTKSAKADAENATHFCMCITPSNVPEEEERALEGGKAALLNAFRWPIGSTIKIRFLEGPTALRERVRQAAEKWIAPGMAKLQFGWLGAGDADVRIAFQQGDGSWSYIGTYGRQIPKNEPTMNFGWLDSSSTDREIREVVLHEVGHAIGLIHEHQNPQHAIQWNKAAVRRDLSGPPNNWDDATIEHNMFERYDPATLTATRVDRKSIMMYPIPRTWTLDGFSSGMNSSLSSGDRRLIKKVYR